MHTVGPKGEGGLDDATGAGGAGGASMKQSSAVVDLGTFFIPYQPIIVQFRTRAAYSELTAYHFDMSADSMISAHGQSPKLAW